MRDIQRLFLTVFCIACGAAVSTPVFAKGQSDEVSVPLTALTQGQKVVVLRPKSPSAQLVWSVPAHRSAENVTLTLRYLTSPDTPKGSQLVVANDHRIVGAINLNAALPKGSVTLRLVRGMVKAGDHTFEIRILPGAVQTPAQLAGFWTQVDYTASKLQYTSTIVPWRHVDFTHLSAMLNDSGTKGVVHLPVALYGDVTAPLLTATQEAVAGLALRTDRLLKISAVRQLPGSQDSGIALAIGVSSDLPKFLLPTSPIVGPTVYLYRDPMQPSPITVVVTGKNPEQVHTAALQFAVNRMALPLGHRWNIASGASPVNLKVTPADALYPGRRTSLKALEGAQAVQEQKPQRSAQMHFWMPGGLYASRQAQLKLRLTMATQPDTPTVRHPLITVLANNRWISSWKLTPGVANYETTIPFTALQGGENAIDFIIRGGKVAVFRNSTLELPHTHQYAELPDLRYFADTGFPLVVNGSGKKLTVWYSRSEPKLWSAGLTLFARLAQASHSPLPETSATTDMPKTGNVLAIGTFSSTPTQWMTRSPVRIRHGELQWRAASSARGSATWTGAIHAVGAAYLLESPTPYSGGVAVSFLAKNAAGASAAAWKLVASTAWQHLRGDFAWLSPRGTWQATMVGSHFIYGHRDSAWYYVFLFSLKPYLWLLVVSAAILFAAVLAWIFTARKKAQWRAEEAI